MINTPTKPHTLLSNISCHYCSSWDLSLTKTKAGGTQNSVLEYFTCKSCGNSFIEEWASTQKYYKGEWKTVLNRTVYADETAISKRF